MSQLRIAKASVPKWNPAVFISDRASLPDDARSFLHELPLAYETPDITFSKLGPTLVGGGFTLKSDAHGPIEDSFYLWPTNAWERTIPADFKLSQVEDAQPHLIIGNVATSNYYHWNHQSLASLLIFRKHVSSEDFATVVPNLNRWQSETFSVIDFDGAMIQMEDKDVVYFANVVYSNLSGGAFVKTPHPAISAVFEEVGRDVRGPRKFGRKIYASRLDAGDTRRIINEDKLCELMVQHGFEVITPGKLSVEEQIVAFRDADVIVGPHGAGMTNILYAKPGTRVVELFQAACTHLCYAKIAQLKGLDYRAVISPDFLNRDSSGQLLPIKNVDHIACEADLRLIGSVISGL